LAGAAFVAAGFAVLEVAGVVALLAILSTISVVLHCTIMIHARHVNDKCCTAQKMENGV
jgi:Tfp pilus assembly protein PilE